MQLKENVWYIIDREHDRNEFIDDLCCATRIMKTQMIAQHPEVKTAKVIKYKRKSIDPIIFDINYRTEFKPDYLQGPREHYEPMCKDLSSFSFIDNSTIKEWVDAKIHDRIINGETMIDSFKPHTIDISYGEPRDITKDLMSLKEALNKSKLYKGENNMSYSNEYNAKYLIKQYFDKEEAKLKNEYNKDEEKMLEKTDLYKAAKKVIELAIINRGLYSNCIPTPMNLIKDWLSMTQLNTLSELRKEYDNKVNDLREYCAKVESLVNICDTSAEKIRILDEYNII